MAVGEVDGGQNKSTRKKKVGERGRQSDFYVSFFLF